MLQNPLVLYCTVCVCVCVSRLGLKENECLLFTVRTDGNGVVLLKPDFNKGKEPYR